MKLILKMLLTLFLVNVFITCCYRTAHASSCEGPLFKLYVTATEEKGAINLIVTDTGAPGAALIEKVSHSLVGYNPHVLRLTYNRPSQTPAGEYSFYLSSLYRVLFTMGFEEIVFFRETEDLISVTLTRTP